MKTPIGMVVRTIVTTITGLVTVVAKRIPARTNAPAAVTARSVRPGRRALSVREGRKVLWDQEVLPVHRGRKVRSVQEGCPEYRVR